jgi:hypothetical protein
VDKKAIVSNSLWKVALVLIAFFVLVLLKQTSSPFDIHIPQLLKNLSFGASGVAGAFGVALGARAVWQLIEEKFSSKPPTNKTQQH